MQTNPTDLYCIQQVSFSVTCNMNELHSKRYYRCGRSVCLLQKMSLIVIRWAFFIVVQQHLIPGHFPCVIQNVGSFREGKERPQDGDMQTLQAYICQPQK